MGRKLLWVGDAGVHSGFAAVTHNIAERLVRDYGFDIHVLAVNYQGDHWDTPLKLYPATKDVPYDIQGMSRIIKMCADVMPDGLFFINDPAVVRNTLLFNPWDSERLLWRGMSTPSGAVFRPPIFAYLPIDGYDHPRSWDVLTERVTRIAMTHFGQAAMPEAPVVWHGVDTAVFHPRDRKKAKAALGFDPDRFLILRVDKNSIRKDYAATWRALRPVLRRHSDIDVHFHCQPFSPDGFNLDAVRFNDEDIRDRVTFTPSLSGYTGLDGDRLATLYAAADVFVSTSWGEGFGLTILEAMASGTPVVAQDCSAISEVVGDAGMLIAPGPRITTPMGQEQCLPDTAAFSEAIERLYTSRGRRRALGAAGAERAKRYSWDIAAERMNTIIGQVI